MNTECLNNNSNNGNDYERFSYVMVNVITDRELCHFKSEFLLLSLLVQQIGLDISLYNLHSSLACQTRPKEGTTLTFFQLHYTTYIFPFLALDSKYVCQDYGESHSFTESDFLERNICITYQLLFGKPTKQKVVLMRPMNILFIL